MRSPRARGRFQGWLAYGLLAGAAAVAAPVHAQTQDLPGGPAVNQLNLHPAVTQIAAEQQWLHWFMLILCTVIFLGVFGVMFYSIYKHRRSVGHQAQELPKTPKPLNK